MLQLRAFAQHLVANMGSIALVGLLCYVAFSEFVRPSMTMATVNAGLESVRRALDETARIRGTVDAGLKRIDRAVSLNSGLLQQHKALVDSVRQLQADWQQQKAALDVREQQLRARYEAQKTAIRAAQKTAR